MCAETQIDDPASRHWFEYYLSRMDFRKSLFEEIFKEERSKTRADELERTLLAYQKAFNKSHLKTLRNAKTFLGANFPRQKATLVFGIPAEEEKTSDRVAIALAVRRYTERAGKRNEFYPHAETEISAKMAKMPKNREKKVLKEPKTDSEETKG